MARLIALEWDQQELRLAAGTRHGSTVSVDSLLATPLANDPAWTVEEWEAKLQSSLSQLIASSGLSKSEAILAAARASVELRTLQLPPATDNELPEMVRFAAQRAFAQLGDTWPLDFIRLPSTESVQVLAAATSPLVVAKAKRLSEQSGIVFKRLMLRPLATIALTMASAPHLRENACLIVSAIGDEIDLVIADHGSVGLMRTARIPQGEASFRQKALASEIKRTRIASESQTPSVKPTHLVLWGDIGSGDGVAQGLAEQTGMSITQLSLPNVVDLRGTAGKQATDYDRFVPVVGLLHHALHPEFPSIDFANPRKRVEKKKPIKELAIAAACGALLIATGIWWFWSRHRQLDLQIANLTKESRDLDETVAMSQTKIKEWEKVRKFMQSDIDWLDQLAFLSDHSLSAEKMIFGATKLQVNQMTGEGTISGDIATTGSELLTQYEDQLRKQNYVIKGGGPSRSKDPLYLWSQNTTIRIPPKSTSAIESMVQKMTVPESAKEPESKIESKTESNAPSEAEVSPSSKAVENPQEAPSTEGAKADAIAPPSNSTAPTNTEPTPTPPSAPNAEPKGDEVAEITLQRP